MNYSKRESWERFQSCYTNFPTLGLTLDLSRTNLTKDFFQSMASPMQNAFAEMDALERGAIANPDEKRMVGHYWLRNTALAPSPAIRTEIENTITLVKKFSNQVHDGSIRGEGGPFKNFLLVGIGGSALGPQFIAHALGHSLKDIIRPFFLDNTDPDGIDRVLASIGPELNRTLCLVISKSGSTMETRNGMLEAKAAYERAALNFNRHAVAITQAGSDLDKYAAQQRWLATFPIWEWVGGRTSITSAVGLLSSALLGVKIEEILAGAKASDEITRIHDLKLNPAAQLALAWFYFVNVTGHKNVVILPYKDRLEPFPRYLQQLIMESIGKEFNLCGERVNQGFTVFGNKGSTDQHSFIQLLRDGLDNYFTTFIEVQRDRIGNSIDIGDRVSSGDYLIGFLNGTKQALFSKTRYSITLTIQHVTGFSVGMLIALFERVVGYYASLIQVNAYHQPGVESGKRVAAQLIELQRQVHDCLNKNRGKDVNILDIANALDMPDSAEDIFRICEHLAANPFNGIIKMEGITPFEAKYRPL